MKTHKVPVTKSGEFRWSVRPAATVEAVVEKHGRAAPLELTLFADGVECFTHGTSKNEVWEAYKPFSQYRRDGKGRLFLEAQIIS